MGGVTTTTMVSNSDESAPRRRARFSDTVLPSSTFVLPAPSKSSSTTAVVTVSLTSKPIRVVSMPGTVSRAERTADASTCCVVSALESTWLSS